MLSPAAQVLDPDEAIARQALDAVELASAALRAACRPTPRGHASALAALSCAHSEAVLQAATLAVQGNRYLRAAADSDPDLFWGMFSVQALAQDRERSERAMLLDAYRAACAGGADARLHAAAAHPQLWYAFALEDSAAAFAEHHLQPHSRDEFLDCLRRNIALDLKLGRRVADVQLRVTGAPNLQRARR